MQKVKVIGAGLAGCETAYYLANHGIEVELYDIKPNDYTPAHKSKDFAELVCSNSLKSNDIYGNAAGDAGYCVGKSDGKSDRRGPQTPL